MTGGSGSDTKDNPPPPGGSEELSSYSFPVLMLNATNYIVWAICMKVIFNCIKCGMSLIKEQMARGKIVSP